MMVNEKRKINIVPKEDAVFWMDKNGRWHNQHGPFEHKKLIDYFHASIRKDEQGYYLYHQMDDVEEKVYFRYEHTALFAFKVIMDDDIILVLNTGRQVKLDPQHLVIRNDILFMEKGDEKIKFTTRSMLKISGLIEGENDECFIKVKGKRYQIPNVDWEV